MVAPMHGAIPDRGEQVLERFSRHLGFEFQLSPREEHPRRAIGLAPNGRTGVIDVVDGPVIEVSFLFSHIPIDHQDRDWVDCCLIALADSVGVDFLEWLRSVTRRRSCSGSWMVHHRFGDGEVAVRFLPVDIMILTVHRTH